MVRVLFSVFPPYVAAAQVPMDEKSRATLPLSTNTLQLIPSTHGRPTYLEDAH